MSTRVLMKGNEALVHAAMRASYDADGKLRLAFLGYPITPSSEALEAAMHLIPKAGGVAVQMESEPAASFAVYGAAAAGVHAFTVTSDPGYNWMVDAVGYCATTELPAVFVNIMRGGPALGNIAPSQASVRLAKACSNGDIRTIILAPSTVQELADHTMLAFQLADKWRNPVIVLGDGMLGQMKESLVLPEVSAPYIPPDWRLSGAKGRSSHKFIPFALAAEDLRAMNLKLQQKFLRMDQEARYMSCNEQDADVLIVAFGTVARIAKTVIKKAADEGLRVGLFRPITLWPFPSFALWRAVTSCSMRMLVVEMNEGQMLEDVQQVFGKSYPVEFLGYSGGTVPTVEEMLDTVRMLARTKKRKEVRQ